MAYIQFQDQWIQTALMRAGIGDSSGITYEQAAAYYGTFYQGNNTIFSGVTANGMKYFTELQYFTDVTELCTLCFFYTTLQSVTLPPHLQKIGISAFENTTYQSCPVGFKGKSITIPNTVKYIEQSAFANVKSLTSCNLPTSLEKIGCSAFVGCTSLRQMSMPSKVKRIESHAFANSPSALTSTLILPEGLKYVGDYAFSGVTNVTSMTVPSTLNGEYLGRDGCNSGSQVWHPFSKMTNLSTLISKSNYIGYAWYADLSKLANVTLQNTQTIGGNAFRGTAIRTIAIPNTCTTINGRAFRNCTSLTSLTIPDNVKSLGNADSDIGTAGATWSNESYLISGCTNITTLYVSSGLTGTAHSGMFMYAPKLATVETRCKTIGDAWFAQDGEIANLTMVNTETIGTSAFTSCTKISSIDIPDTVTSIGNYSFSRAGNSANAMIHLSRNCATIPSYAFYNTANRSVYIPSGVTSIGYNAFGGSSNRNFVMQSKVPPTLSTQNYFTFNNLYVRKGAYNAYNTASNWNNGFNIIELAVGITPIEGEYWGLEVSGVTITPNMPAEIMNDSKWGFTPEIYYTTDGSEPTTGSTRYTEPFSVQYVNGQATVKALWVYEGDNYTSSATYMQPKFTMPTVTPQSALTSSSEMTVRVDYTLPESGITLSYRTYAYGDTEPEYTDIEIEGDTQNHMNLTFALSGITILDVKAISLGYRYSDVNRCKYSNYQALQPTVYPESGKYQSPLSISLINNDTSYISFSGQTYQYLMKYATSVDGETYSEDTIYTSAITLPLTDDGLYFRAFTYSTNPYVRQSEYVVNHYELDRIATPTITPRSGYYAAPTISVEIQSPDENAVIYYTTDGSEPTSASTEYTGTFTVNNSSLTTVKAKAYVTGRVESLTAENWYTNAKCNPPTITPNDIIHQESVSVTISADSGDTIYYTIDGTEPTTASTRYTGTFTLTESAEVKAIATRDKKGDSDVTTKRYIIGIPELEILPEEGTYYEDITVRMYSEVGTIYYTTDGTQPTSASTKYTNPLKLTTSATIKAVAFLEDTAISYATRNYVITEPARSRRAPRQSDNTNGIYVKNVTYSGISADYRAYTLPSGITVTDNEADITWGYHVDNVDENLGEYGTRCKVTDTDIIVHVEFTHGGKQHVLEKKIPCTCVVQDAIDTTDTIDIIEAHAIVTLENQLRVVVKARVRHTEEESVAIVTNLTKYTLSGTSTNGNFLCQKDGSYFIFDDVLTLDYSGSTHPANDIELTLLDSLNQELDHHVIQVTFAAGSIFEVRDDAIRMAVASSVTYTDGEISGVTNHLSQLEINISGITGTVSAITNTVSGISADVSQLQQTASSLTSEIYNISGDMVTHSELGQTASAITAYVFDEFGDMTGLDISGGTITLHADQTIIDGQLSIKDGISFKDSSGNPVTTIDGTDIGAYSSHTNGTLTYTNNGGGFRSDAIDYSVTGDWFSVGNYKSGDTISIQEIGLSSYFYLQGSSVPIYNTANSVSLQIQAKKNDDSEPFFTQSLTINKDSDRYYKITGVPIIQITVPADNSLIKLKYVLTSDTSAGGVGTAGFGTWTKYGATINTHSHLGKSGLIIDHSANYTTYIGAEDFKIRKESCGFGFGRYGNSTYSKFTPLVSTMGFGYESPSSGSFPDNPDKQNNTLQYAWIPQDNFIPHTNIRQAVTGGDQSAQGAVCQYGTVTGYSEYGDYNYLRLDERNIVGEVWLDSVQDSSYSELGRFAILLPPPFRQVILGNQTAIYHLPAGYRVKIRNLRNDWASHQWYVWGNESDAPTGYQFPIKIFTGSGAEKSLFISHINGYVDLIFAGVRYNMNQDGNPGYQEWYVANINE